ncbi:MAG: MobB mobilization protein [Candidatus Competibacteraceae bacterium]|jgi:hypothetical protein|nr:MobB mobilization protein [Candidatus Competibacteraceae bacterium]
MSDKLDHHLADEPSDYLDAVINVRVKRSEKAQLKENARLAGLSISALVRRHSLNRKVIADVDMVMIRELRRLGGLVKHIHNESSGAYQEQTATILDQLSNAIDRIANDRKKGS